MAKVSIEKIIKIPKEVFKKGGVVILDLKEYQELQERAAPVYYLKGKKARDLDKLVEQGLEEYKEKKTKAIKSLADLD